MLRLDMYTSYESCKVILYLQVLLECEWVRAITSRAACTPYQIFLLVQVTLVWKKNVAITY